MVHPDQNPTAHSAATAFAVLGKARATLLNPHKRTEYDAASTARRTRTATTSTPTAARSSTPRSKPSVKYPPPPPPPPPRSQPTQVRSANMSWSAAPPAFKSVPQPNVRTSVYGPQPTSNRIAGYANHGREQRIAPVWHAHLWRSQAVMQQLQAFAISQQQQMLQRSFQQAQQRLQLQSMMLERRLNTRA